MRLICSKIRQSDWLNLNDLFGYSLADIFVEASSYRLSCFFVWLYDKVSSLVIRDRTSYKHAASSPSSSINLLPICEPYELYFL